MKKFTIIAAALALTTASCSAVTPPDQYSVKATLTPDFDGATAYIVDFDAQSKIDSCIVKDGEALFAGKIEHPTLATLIINGQKAGTFILEPGQISLADKQALGTPLNERMDSLDKALNALEEQYRAIETDPDAGNRRYEIVTRYDALIDSTMVRNMDNPIGYYLFLQKSYEMTLPELEAAVEAHPNFASSKRITKLIETARVKERTSVGKKMVDFEIQTPDGPKKLSDYVGHDKYVLVDFWASWCGPCRKEIKTLKKILAESDPEKLEVLGVAVWDDPDATKAAIEQLQIPWEVILDAQSIPTDLYGISGIPCIILFGPDGTILVRDLQGPALEAAVKEAISQD